MGNISDEIIKQSADMGWANFPCSFCKHYMGGCACSKGVFIAFAGANLSMCSFQDKGKACPHCGRYI